MKKKRVKRDLISLLVGVLLGLFILIISFVSKFFGIFGWLVDFLFIIFGWASYDLNYLGIGLGMLYGFVVGVILSEIYFYVKKIIK